MKRQLLLLLFLASLSFTGKSQQETTEEKWGIKFGGFVNTQIFWDTRQSESARETMLLFYPKNEMLDTNGEDINAAPSMNQLSIISRLSGAISGPDVLGAKFRGLLEADFSGQTNEAINLFRLRHAYVALDWGHSSLLIGQTWHPMNVPEMMPGVQPLNNGAPFHPFSRHVQVRYIYKTGNFHFIASAIAQRDNASPGPTGTKSEYLINSAIPNLNLQIQYRGQQHLVGAGVDQKFLKPRIYYEHNAVKYKQDELLSSLAGIVFWNYKMPEWNLKLEAIYGPNQTEHLLLGGYAESAFDTVSQTINYTNWNQFATWMEFARSKGTWRPAIFAAFAKNVGYQNKIIDFGKAYGRGGNIDYVYRVAPRLSFFASKKLIFTAEVEYTSAAYGKINNFTGKVSNANEIGMFRFLLDVTYHF